MLLEELILDKGYLCFPQEQQHLFHFSRAWAFHDRTEAIEFTRKNNMRLISMGNNYSMTLCHTYNGFHLVFQQFNSSLPDYRLQEIDMMAFAFDEEDCWEEAERARLRLRKEGLPRHRDDYVIKELKLADYDFLDNLFDDA